jgi:hypothetical protein
LAGALRRLIAIVDRTQLTGSRSRQVFFPTRALSP